MQSISWWVSDIEVGIFSVLFLLVGALIAAGTIEVAVRLLKIDVKKDKKVVTRIEAFSYSVVMMATVVFTVAFWVVDYNAWHAMDVDEQCEFLLYEEHGGAQLRAKVRNLHDSYVVRKWAAENRKGVAFRKLWVRDNAMGRFSVVIFDSTSYSEWLKTIVAAEKE